MPLVISMSGALLLLVLDKSQRCGLFDYRLSLRWVQTVSQLSSLTSLRGGGPIHAIHSEGIFGNDTSWWVKLTQWGQVSLCSREGYYKSVS